ncbi:hypothetical protein BMR1_02g01680 [Babesia microti strain RI]|uniref:Uncharacterized protein n=1 Tax=Babesia microti (strain RI) TaxID=1133968 RepID=I7IQ48_BABMR|nr:hypothetical protein BMR1_02g01680 [Babesia microti strain RI]CCF73495.1 hypothetical protein BMR1_02g01680 [Babesia microti strain RI]|eukprot:XP_012648104.1 hypothetical protein BMR1_02g01680 [Babesia microti strain RI]
MVYCIIRRNTVQNMISLRLHKIFLLFPQRGYFIFTKVLHLHGSKCRWFPRITNISNKHLNCNNEPYGNVSDFEDEILMSDEDILYKDLEINNFGSAIGAKMWHSLPTETSYSSNDSNCNQESYSEEQRQLYESNSDHSFDDYKADTLEQMKRLLDEELKEKERIFDTKPQYLKLKDDNGIENNSNDERTIHSVGTVEKLRISNQLSQRSPSSKTNYTRKQLKEHKIYTNYTNLLEKTDSHYYCSKYNQHNNKSENRRKKISNKVHAVRVLNIDKLPLEILHHMVAYNLVKYMPAEKVIRVIWRIASYRDKISSVAYQNLHLDIGKLVPDSCCAEMVALLSRAHQTVSIPFLVDYVRNFGTFSRSYIAKSLDKSAKPRLFDFVRFSRFGGTKKLPLVLTQPRTLLGYVNLLKDCSAKKYMTNNLTLLGLVPNNYKFEKYHAYGTLDENLADSLIQSERLLVDPELPEEKYKSDDQNRPQLYDLIMKSQTLGIPIEDLLEDNLSTNPMLSKYAKSSTATNVNVKSTAIMSQLIPLVPEESTIDSINSIKTGNLGYKNIDTDVPIEGRRTWTLPWTVINNSFIYKGKKYKLNECGWQIMETSDDERNWYKRSSREIRRKYSRKLTLKKMALKLSRANSNCF